MMIIRSLKPYHIKTHNLSTITPKSQRLIPQQRPFYCPPHHLFDETPKQPSNSNNDLLFHYSRQGLNHQALDIFYHTHQSGGHIDGSTLSSTFKACGALPDPFLGKQLHAFSVALAFDADVSVATSLIDMYMKCTFVEDARMMFEWTTSRNVVTWTALLTGFGHNAEHSSVLDNYLRMRVEGVVPNSFTFVAVLGASAALGAAEDGSRAHALLVKLGFGSAVFVGNSLMNMYLKCGALEDAKTMFECMEDKTTVSWNTMFAGFAQHGFDSKALGHFSRMREEGYNPSQLNYAAIVKSCANLKELDLGRQFHCSVWKRGFVMDENINTALTVLYSKCKKMEDAFKLFTARIGYQNVVSWTAMISGLMQNNMSLRAGEMFMEMMREGVRPNDFTYSTILTVFPVISSSQFHALVIKSNYESAPSVGTALLVAYTKLGETDKSICVFRQISGKDIMTWSAMVASFAQVGNIEGAIGIYCEMVGENMKPNEYTLSGIIDVCASSAAIAEQGKLFHGVCLKYGFESAICVSSALVSMYAKRGSIESAWVIFDSQIERDLVSWNGMIAGYAQHGFGLKALEIFQQMKSQNLAMDKVTFLGVLSACVHAGLLQKGRTHFDSMIRDHNISPTMEHYSCMVDLYGRAGELEQAMDLIKRMEKPASATVWRTLLGACRVHRNVDLGKVAAKELIALDPQDSSAYVLLSNMYASVGNWDERAKIRRLMDERKVKKEAGYSWIEVKNNVHSFLAGDRSHPMTRSIYRKLEEVMSRLKELGHRADTTFVLQDVEEEKKEAILAQHSERLAVAFGLIATPEGSPLQIVKNLRVCGDCHSVIKLISKMEGRYIVMRDSNRFHHFKDGSCSCGDYW